MYEANIMKTRSEIADLTKALEERNTKLRQLEIADHQAKVHASVVFRAKARVSSINSVQLHWLASHVTLRELFLAFSRVNGIDLILTEKFMQSVTVANLGILNKNLDEILCWFADTLPDMNPEEKDKDHIHEQEA